MGPGTHPGTVTFELGAAYELVSQDDLQIIVHDREPGRYCGCTYSGRRQLLKQYQIIQRRETTAAESSSDFPPSNHTTAAETSQVIN